MVLYSSKAFNVSLPAGKTWICVECKERPGSQSFQSGLLKALEYIKGTPTNSWLLDFREIDWLGEEEETWLQVQFFPQLMMLGYESYFAVVVSESCYDKLLNEVGAYGLKSYNSFIIINTFCHMQEAEEWLSSHHPNPVL
ncbi:hypothetical protein WG947_00560 [Pontibacter sp. H259]|uniref:hypothetical protein n=1 Tax=Pontibacter sp. H259 TaxID=3133421 RepID=UPI0030BBFDC3